MTINVGLAALMTCLGTAVLTGCGVGRQSSAPPKPHPEVQQATLKSNSGDLSVLDPHWIMPNRLPSPPRTKEQGIESQTWPVYNTQLAMNRFPQAWHGNDLVNTWKLPPKWAPYLYKNEKHVPTYGDLGTEKIPLTLYITLQGTVFLYPQTISENQWPASLTIGDIPPTTIVAEFVPLKPAVEAGIIPENANQPSYPGSGFVPRVWQKALGMSSAQIVRSLR